MKPLFIFLLVLVSQPVLAADDSLLSGEMMNYIGFGAIVFTLILFVIVMLVLLRTFKVMTKIILGP